MTNRLHYIDYLKALGICLVVCYHSRYIPFDNTVFAGLFSCCVPIFFMVNGYMMLRKERTISDLWKSNLKLIGLTIIWSFILSASYMLLTGEFSCTSLKDSLIAWTKHSLYFDQNYSNYLWFLQALIVLNAINPILYYFIHRRKNNIWYLVILFGFTTIQIFDYLTNKYINPFMNYPYRYSFLYYVLGYALLSDDVLPDLKAKLQSWKYTKVCLWGGIVAAMIMQYLYIQILQGPLQSLGYAKSWIRPDLIGTIWDGYGAFFVVCMTALLCLAFKYTWSDSNISISHTGRLWAYVGRISLPLYLIHPIFTHHVGHFLSRFDWYAANHYTHIILPIAALLLSLAVSYLLSLSRPSRWLITTR